MTLYIGLCDYKIGRVTSISDLNYCISKKNTIRDFPIHTENYTDLSLKY